MLLYNNITAIYIEKLATSMVFNQTEMIYIYIYIYISMFVYFPFSSLLEIILMMQNILA
jgi:hypothetical protein